MPEDWLAWVKFSDLTSTEELGDQLLKPFGMQLVGFKRVLQQFAGDSLAMDRPVLFGTAYSEVTQSGAGFAIIPIDDFEIFATQQGLSLDEELWLTRFFGVDLVMVPVENYLWISQLDAEVPAVTKKTLASISELKEEEVTVQFSNRGLKELSEWLEANRTELLRSSRGRLPRVAKPKDLSQLLRQSIRYSPLVAKLSEEYSQLKLTFTSQNQQLVVKASLSDTSSDATDMANNFQKVLAESNTAFTDAFKSEQVTYQASGNLGKGIFDLVLTTYGCHPESVESIAYDEKSYDLYQEACLSLTDAVESIEFMGINPSDDKPIGRNEFILLEMDPNLGDDEIKTLFKEVGSTWNQVIDSSRARVKLKVDQSEEQLSLASADEDLSLESLVFSIDMIEAFGGTRYQEIQDLFESLYGEDCKLKIRLISVGGSRWGLTLLPNNETKRVLTHVLESLEEPSSLALNKPKAIVTTYHPDKHMDWLRKIDDLMYKDSVGRLVKKPMEPVEPIHAVVTESATGIHAMAKMPIMTYQKVIAYLLAPKVKPE